MSDIITEASASDVSVDSSSSGDVFADVDFSSTFGLEPEAQPDVTPDVPEAPDLPDSRQVNEDVPAGDEVQEEEAVVAETPDTEAPQDAPAETSDSKLDFATAPKAFREEMTRVQSELMRLRDASPETQFITDPVAFKDWMKETSPTAFNEVGSQIATESANAHPDQWLKFFAETHPDLLAQAATGREGMTAERLQAEMEILLDEDDPDVQAAMEKNRAAETPKAAESPETKEIREWREQRAEEKYQAAVKTVYEPIVSEIDNLVSQAGLDVNQSDLQGKPFDSLDADTQLKVLVNNVLIPNSIDYFVKSDPKLLAMQSRMDEFLASKDKDGNPKEPDIASAMKLQHAAKITATNAVNTVLSLLTNQIAKTKESDQTPPAQDKPAPMVKSAGQSAIAAPMGLPTKADWAVTDSDLR